MIKALKRTDAPASAICMIDFYNCAVCLFCPIYSYFFKQETFIASSCIIVRNLSIHLHVAISMYSMGKQIPNSNSSGTGAVVYELSFHKTWAAFWLQ